MTDENTNNTYNLLDHAQTVAVREFVRRSAVPMLAGRGEVVGTAHLFGVAGETFLITARHVVAEVAAAGFNPAEVGVPVSSGGHRFITLRQIQAAGWDDWENETLDVTVLRLESDDVVELLRRDYEILSADNVAPLFAIYDRYTIAGFPAETYQVDGNTVTPVGIAVSAGLWPGSGAPTDPADRVFRLKYPTEAFDEFSNKGPVPRIKGMSGAAVWGVALFPPPEGLWTAAEALRLAGVQYAALEHQYLACARWSLAAAQIMAYCPASEALLWERLKEPPVSTV
jgi:hypothetical protein